MNTVRTLIVIALAVLATLASTVLVISPVAFAHTAEVARRAPGQPARLQDAQAFIVPTARVRHRGTP